MTRARRSEIGPQSQRAEVEVSRSCDRLAIEPVPPAAPEAEREKKPLTAAEFLAKCIPYDGPPITDEMMEKAILEEAKRRWERVQRQMDEDLDD